jgi:hypothetical protein
MVEIRIEKVEWRLNEGLNDHPKREILIEIMDRHIDRAIKEANLEMSRVE